MHRLFAHEALDALVAEPIGAHVLVRHRDEAVRGHDPVVHRLPAVPGQLLVVVSEEARQAKDLVRLLATLLRPVLADVPATSVWLGLPGLGGNPAAQRLARALGVEVVAPDGPLVTGPGAVLYAGHGTGATGWWRVGAGADPAFAGQRWPAAPWQSVLPIAPATVGDVVVEPVPAGILVRAGSPAPVRAVDPAFTVVGDDRLPRVVVGGGEDVPTPAAVATVLGWLAPGRAVLVPAAPEVCSHTWQRSLAARVGADVLVTTGLPGGTGSTITPVAEGAYRPFPTVLRQGPDGGRQQVAEIAPAPRGWVRHGVRAYRPLDGDGVVAEVVPSGLVLRSPAAGAAVDPAPFDPTQWFLYLGNPGEPVDLTMLTAADDLLGALDPAQRAAARIRVLGTLDPRAGATLTRVRTAHAQRPAPAEPDPVRDEHPVAQPDHEEITPEPTPTPVSEVPVDTDRPDITVEPTPTPMSEAAAHTDQPDTIVEPAPTPVSEVAVHTDQPDSTAETGVVLDVDEPADRPDTVAAAAPPLFVTTTSGSPSAPVEPMPVVAPRPVEPTPVFVTTMSGPRAEAAVPAPVPAQPPVEPAPVVEPTVDPIPLPLEPIAAEPPVEPAVAASTSDTPEPLSESDPRLDLPVDRPTPVPPVTFSGPVITTSSSPVSTMSGPAAEPVEVEPEAPVDALPSVEPEAPVAPVVGIAPPPLAEVVPLALVDRSSSAAEQARLTASAGELFGEALATVNAALATWPSLRQGESAGIKADYVAVCLYLGRGAMAGTELNQAVRAGEGAALAGLVPCLVSGIRRLPVHRRAVLRQGTLGSAEHSSAPGVVLTEPGFLSASMDLDITVADADLDVLIWPATARRTSELVVGRPVGEAVFAATSRFKALAVRTATGEVDPDREGPVAPRVAALFRELAPGEQATTTDLDEQDLAVLAKLDSVLARRQRATLRLVDDQDAAARLTSSLVLWQHQSADRTAVGA